MSSTLHIFPSRFRAYLRHPRVRAAWLSFAWSVVLLYFCFCALVLTTRWILLPQVDKYKDDIARYVGSVLHAEVSIGRVSPRWDTFWPRLSLRDVVIERPDPRSRSTHVLRLPEVEASFYWSSLLGQPVFRHLQISNAQFTVRRVGENVFDIAGFLLDLNDSAADGAFKTHAGSSGLCDWILRQGRIDVTNGRILYENLLSEDHPRGTALTEVNFTFESGVNDYRVGFQAELAGRLDNSIDLRARFAAPLFGERGWNTWTGEAYASIDALNIARLLRPVEAVRRVLKAADGDTRTWLRFHDGRIEELTSRLALSDVVLQLSPETDALRIRRLSTKLFESFADAAVSLKAEDLAFELADGTKCDGLVLETLLAATPSASDDARRSMLRVNELDVRSLIKLLGTMPVPAQAAERIRTYDASGVIRDLEFSWGGGREPDLDWRLSAEFERLSLAPKSAQANAAGFENLSGKLQLQADSGQIELASYDGALYLPDVFEDPRLPVDALSGRVGWHREATESGREELVVTFDGMHAANGDADVEAEGVWRDNGTPAGHIELTGAVARARADRAWRYMPVSIPESVRDWLQGGLVSGEARNGMLELRGDLHDYPWIDEKSGQGRFFITAELVDAALDYVPSMKILEDGGFERGALWPLLTDIYGRLTFEGAGMRIEADSAKTGGTDLRGIVAEIPHLDAGNDTRLIVRGQAQGTLQKFFDYVEASPVTHYLSGAFTGTKAEGSGRLELALDIALLEPEKTKVDGAIILEGADIDMGWPKPPLKDVEGTVYFSEKGARATAVKARAFGSGDASVSVHTDADGSIIISAAGSTDAAGIAWFARSPHYDVFAKQISGMLPFVSTVSIKKGGVSVSAHSSLQGVAIDLPEPLKKNAQDALPASFSFTPIVRNGRKGHFLQVDLGERFHTRLQLPDENSKLPLLGSFAVGTRTTLPKQGFALGLEATTLTVLDWQPYLRKLLDLSAPQEKTAAKSGAAPTRPPFKLDAHVASLVLEDGVIRKARAAVDVDARGNADIDLASEEILGRVRYESAGRGSITGSFERLILPSKSFSTLRRVLEGETVDVVITPRPTVLPSLDLIVDDFVYDGRKIGRLLLQAEASGDADNETLHINNFAVLAKDSALTGTGSWSQGRKLTAEHPGQTQFKLDFSTRNLGGTLADLGFEDFVRDGSGQIKGEFKFDGIPWAPKIDTIAGSYSIDLRKGAFEKVDTGAGGLVLSLLSFQSLLKRLTLDFEDFRGSLAFDTLNGTSSVQNGVVSSENLKIAGTHGTVLVSGDLNLVEGNVDSRVVVLPDINAGNASLALAFVNPAVGIGSFIAQLLLRDPLSRLFKVEYAIKGPWDNPTVSKLDEN